MSVDRNLARHFVVATKRASLEIGEVSRMPSRMLQLCSRQFHLSGNSSESFGGSNSPKGLFEIFGAHTQNFGPAKRLCQQHIVITRRAIQISRNVLRVLSWIICLM